MSALPLIATTKADMCGAQPHVSFGLQFACNKASPPINSGVEPPSLPFQELFNFFACLVDREDAVEVTEATPDLDLIDQRAVAFDQLRGQVHRIGMKNQIVVAGDEENRCGDLPEAVDQIAAARNKKLAGLDKIEEMVASESAARALPRASSVASISYWHATRQFAGFAPGTAQLRP